MSPEQRIRVRMFLRENWYRDVWLLVISAVVVFSIIVGYSQNKARINDVQHERQRSILAQCLGQNAEHGNIIRTLYRLNPPLKKTRKGRDSAEQFAASIAPVRDCKQVVANAVPSKQPMR